MAVSVSGNLELNKPHCSTRPAEQPRLCSLSQTLGPGALPPGISEFKNVGAGRDLSPHLVLSRFHTDGETEAQGGKGFRDCRILAFPLSPASASRPAAGLSAAGSLDSTAGTRTLFLVQAKTDFLPPCNTYLFMQSPWRDRPNLERAMGNQFILKGSGADRLGSCLGSLYPAGWREGPAS